MKASYHDFLIENPKCGKDLETSTGAKAVFDLLSRDWSIIAMIEASDSGKPALSPVVLIIENYCTKNPSDSFDLANEQRRTVVGCMIKTILSRFGYEPIRPSTRTQKELSRTIGAKYFVSGSCYSHVPLAPASMRIVRTVSIEPAVFSLVRELQCPYCKSTNAVDLENEYHLFSETRTEEARHLKINFYKDCVACNEQFIVSGYIIECPLGDIEREEITSTPAKG